MKNSNSSDLNKEEKAKHTFLPTLMHLPLHIVNELNRIMRRMKNGFSFQASGKKKKQIYFLSRITVNMFNAIRKGLKSFS